MKITNIMIHSNIIIQKLDISAGIQCNKRWPIVYIKGPQVIFSEKKCILSLTIVFVLADRVDSDQMRIWICAVCQNTDLRANSR